MLRAILCLLMVVFISSAANSSVFKGDISTVKMGVTKQKINTIAREVESEENEDEEESEEDN